MLPAPAPAGGNYVTALEVNGFLYLAGQLPKDGEEIAVTGRLGDDLTVEHGMKAARIATLNALAQAKAALGSLDRIAGVVKVTGYINATSGFAQHSQFMNGASDIVIAIFGDKGRHTRTSVGVVSLPRNAAVELEFIFALA